MEKVNPRNILAIGVSLALLALPISYCTVQDAKHTAAAKVACAQSGGDWRFGSCRIGQ